MQDGHNDYLLLTRGYLKDYKRLMDMRNGWIAEMSDTQRELASVPVAVSKYGDEPGGGSGESSPTERLASGVAAVRPSSACVAGSENAAICTPERIHVVMNRGQLNRKARAASAGLTMFAPMPPKSCLTRTMAKKSPISMTQ